MIDPRITIRWAPEWYSKNRIDGETRHFMWTIDGPRLFWTRRECKAWIDKEYGYIKNRPDLRKEPHGWRMPRPVRVRVELISLSNPPSAMRGSL